MLTSPHLAEDLLALCGRRAGDMVDITALPELARHWWPDGSRLDLAPDADTNAAAVAAFCAEGAAFRRFDAQCGKVLAALGGPVLQSARPSPGRVMAATLQRPALGRVLRPGVTLDGPLRQHFRDPRLIQLFGRYATYVGGRPAPVPAVLALIWRVEAAGVCRVKGGPSRLLKNSPSFSFYESLG